MSIVFSDGFDYYRNETELNQNYWYFYRYPTESSLFFITLVDLDSFPPLKRFPNSVKCIAVSGGTHSDSTVSMFRAINTQTSEFVVGFAIKYKVITATSGVPLILSFYDHTGSVAFSIGASFIQNRYEIYDKSNTFAGHTPDNSFDPTKWHYVEIEGDVSSSSTIRLHIDGMLAGTFTGVNTLNTGVTVKNARLLRFRSGSSSSTRVDYYLDDIYVVDKSGIPNSPLGNIRIDFIKPSVTIASNMNTSSGSDSATLLRNNDRNSYIYTSATGASAVFAFNSLPHNPQTIHAVSIVIRDYKTAPFAVNHHVSLDEDGTLSTFTIKSTENDVIKKNTYVQTPKGNNWTKTTLNNIRLKIERG